LKTKLRKERWIVQEDMEYKCTHSLTGTGRANHATARNYQYLVSSPLFYWVRLWPAVILEPSISYCTVPLENLLPREMISFLQLFQKIMAPCPYWHNRTNS
jgi:hypothetical protein